MNLHGHKQESEEEDKSAQAENTQIIYVRIPLTEGSLTPHPLGKAHTAPSFQRVEDGKDVRKVI